MSAKAKFQESAATPVWMSQFVGGAPVEGVGVTRVRGGEIDGALAFGIKLPGFEQAVGFPMVEEDWARLVTALVTALGGDMRRFIPTSASAGLVFARDLGDVAAFQRGEWR